MCKVIKINESWAIATDRDQFVLKEVKTVQDKKSKNFGEEVYRDHSFHTSLEGLFKKVSKQNILDNWPDLKKVYEINSNLMEEVKRLEAVLGCF